LQSFYDAKHQKSTGGLHLKLAGSKISSKAVMLANYERARKVRTDLFGKGSIIKKIKEKYDEKNNPALCRDA
jgi:hypothetical protein